MTSNESLADKFIVVVDDEEPILNSMRTLLEQWRCTVVTAVSAHDAVSKLHRSTRVPDALVCGCGLGADGNSMDMIDVLRDEFNHEIPALVMTNYATSESIKETLSSGFPVLSKPVQATILHEVLVQVIGNVHTTEQRLVSV